MQADACARMEELSDASIERLLLQFTYLAAERPSCALERAVVDICARSFTIAVKVGAQCLGGDGQGRWLNAICVGSL